MKCIRCDTANRAERQYCKQCGAPLPAPCPDCGFTNEADENFCGGCGQPIRSEKVLIDRDASTVGAGVGANATAAPAAADFARDASCDPERRQVTILFCDLVGSTQLAQRLDPEDLRPVIRAYQETSRQIIAQYGGLVARYFGDGIFAQFGYPNAHEDDAERAVRSALAIAEAVPKLKLTSHRRVQGELAVRIGVATGLVVAGDLIGKGSSEEWAVVGEAPNLAARLQSIAGANEVIIGPSTRVLVGSVFEYQALGHQDLKGFDEPVEAWRALEPRDAESRFAVTRGNDISPLIGRERELQQLWHSWRQASRGPGAAVLLKGEAGIGKSRLVRALEDALGAEPHLKMRFQCSPFHTNSALYPICCYVERAAGFARGDSNARKLAKLENLLADLPDRVEEIAPVFAALLNIPTMERYAPLKLTPQQEKSRIIRALIEQMKRLSTYEPLLVLFEDAHWIDPTSRELLDNALQCATEAHALIVVTSRPGDPPQLAQATAQRCIELDRLPTEETFALAAQVAKGKRLPDGVLSQLAVRSDGIPLYIEELTESLLASGSLRETEHAFVLDGSLPPPQVPATLKDSLTARLDQLAATRIVAQVGAVIGREFPFRLLSKVGELPEQELSAALSELVDARILTQDGVPPDASYTFKHALVEDAAYDSLLRSRRQQYHTRIAHVLQSRLEIRGKGEPELVAHHYHRAGAFDRAVHYWLVAGHRAAEQSAFVEACAHLNAALRALPQLPESEERLQTELQIQIALGNAYTGSAGYAAPSAGEAFARAFELCQELADPPEIFPVMCGLHGFHLMRGDIANARRTAEHLLERAATQKDSLPSLLGHRSLGTSLLMQGNLEPARYHLQRALSIYEAEAERYPVLGLANATDEKCIICSYLSLAQHFLGHLDEALESGEASLAHAEARGHLHSIGFARAFLDGLRLIRGEPQIALNGAEQSIEFSLERGFPNWVAISRIHKGAARVQLGAVREGITNIRQGIKEFSTPGSRAFLPLALYWLARALEEAQLTQESLEVVGQALDAVEATDERWYEAELRRLLGELLWRMGKRPEAEAALIRSLHVARKQSAKLWELRTATTLGRFWAEQNNQPQARQLIAPIERCFTQGQGTCDLTDARRMLQTLEPEPALSSG